MECESYSAVHQVERTHWFFVARRQIIASLLRQFLHGSDHAWLLDVGGGTGGLTDVLTQFGRVVGVDYSEEALLYYRQHHPVVCRGDATRLPFNTDSLDFILALDLLEHLEEDTTGLVEFYRVLKPGGRAFFTVPAFRFLWGRLDDVAHHYRRYTRGELCNKVRHVGFRVLKSSYMNTLLFPLVVFARRTESLRARWMNSDADLNVPPVPVNAALTTLFSAEANLIRKWELPFGVSVICVVEK